MAAKVCLYIFISKCYILIMMETFTIVYRFVLPDNHVEKFELTFDAQTIEILTNKQTDPPFWADLAYHQCPHCPLTPESDPICPVALNLSTVITRFDRIMSFETVNVKVISNEREVLQTTSAQEGIGSVMGLLIAGSRCPLTHFFKPMARFHLPFANKDETIWRAAATFLLARYFTREGLQAEDMALDRLIRIYDDIAVLNDYVVERLRAATSQDSAVNALVHLDVYAKFLVPPLADALDQIKPIFKPFLVKHEIRSAQP
jgi:hypothetical protein